MPYESGDDTSYAWYREAVRQCGGAVHLSFSKPPFDSADQSSTASGGSAIFSSRGWKTAIMIVLMF